MARLTLFHHDPRATTLSRLDPRVKLAILAAAGTLAFFLSGRGIILLGAAAAALFPLGKASFRDVVRGGFVLWAILALLFLSRLFGLPGTGLFSVLGATATREGLAAGSLEAGRILVLVLLGHLFTASTSVADLQRALLFYLRPLPGRRGALLSLYVGLAAGLVPRLLDSAGEIREALTLRGFRFRRRPLAGVLFFGKVFFRKALREGLAAAEALEVRGYRLDRKHKPLRFAAADWLGLAASSAVLAGLLLLG